MSIARNEGESFTAFKERRSEDNAATKEALKPKLFWDSYYEGTYKNKDRAAIKAERTTRKQNKGVK